MRYRSIVYFLAAFCLLLGSCADEEEVVSPEGLFGQDWYNTFETDELGVDTYRPFSVGVPGWGIDGFRFEADGRFVRYTQGPADELLTLTGTWTTDGDKLYRIEFANGQGSNYILLIVSVENSVLKARRP